MHWRTRSARDWTRMNAPLPDLALCAQEPIRIPGAIQPHGWMAVASPQGELVAHSAHWADTDRAAPAVRMVKDRFGDIGAQGEGPAALGTVQLGDATLDVLGHRSGQHLVLEFEPHTGSSGTQAPIYSLARHFLPRLQRSASLDELMDL